MNNLYIFDLDGTLIDSFSQILEAVNLTLVRHDLPNCSSDFLFPLIGLHPSHFFANLELENSEVEPLVSEFRIKLARETQQGLVFFPGALDLLDLLKRLGHQVAVATNKPTSLAKSMLASSQAQKFIDFCIGTGSFEPKPSPDMINEVLAYFSSRGVKRKNSILLGDRNEDIEAGYMAGITCIFLEQSGHVLNSKLRKKEVHIFKNILDYYSYLRNTNPL